MSISKKDFGRVLSNTPPIVEGIFKHLGMRDLHSCSCVCELWKRVAETEKNQRDDVVWFFQGIRCLFHDEVHSSSRQCSMDLARDIEDELSQQMKDTKIRPAFCLTFATNYFINDFERLFPNFQYPLNSRPKRIRQDTQEDFTRKRSYLKAAMQFAVEKHLPAPCKSTFCVAPGIIGCRPNCASLEVEEGWAVAGYMLPSIPGLEVHCFPVDEKKSDISTLIPENSRIKCLLVFISPFDSTCYNKIIQACLLKEQAKIAVGGAVVDRCESHSGSFVAFCGENVEAASVIIKPTDKEAELEKKLKRFQETGLLQDRCFAFMFACVARGFFNYREYDLESSVFHKMYPGIPLIGVFGNGEIGVEYLPNTPTDNPVLHIGKLARSRKRYLHSYTTVFVLVSLKL